MINQIIENFLQVSEKEWDSAKKEGLRSDANFISKYSLKSNDQFLNFHCWQLNLLGIIEIDKIDYFKLLEAFTAHSDLTDHQRQNIDGAISTVDPTPSFVSGSNIIEEIVDFHISMFSFVDEHATPKYRSVMIEDLKKHLTFLDQATEASSPILWTEYLNWLDSVLTSLNIKTITLIRFLISCSLLFKTKNEPIEKTQYLDKGVQHLIKSLKSKADPVAESDGLLPEAQKYLDYLIKADRKRATEFIMNLLDEQQWPIKDVYIKIFQESQYEIGRRWEKNKVTVAQEHFCTATTQMIMSILYPRLLSSARINKSVITTCVGSELHEIGIRMISDFLEMDGWDTYYTGANTPKETIIEAIRDQEADVLAISVTLTPHIAQAAELIQVIKESNQKVKILIGGYPFIQDPELYKKIGADGVAQSAKNINELAHRIITS